MLKVRVIPCMLFNGMCLVKSIQFSDLRNLGNPVQMARVYNSRNVDELAFIDILATAEGREPLYDVIEEIVGECFMPLAVGGGIRNSEMIRRLLGIGADKVIINSAALENPSFIAEAARFFGSQCVTVAIDARFAGNGYAVFANRGTLQTEKNVVEWARESEKRGAGEIFLTSIDRDGMMSGYDLELIRLVTAAVHIPVIAHGGAGKVQDVIDAIRLGNASSVSLASMFHYSGHTADSIKRRMSAAGIPVRL